MLLTLHGNSSWLLLLLHTSCCEKVNFVKYILILTPLWRSNKNFQNKRVLDVELKVMSIKIDRIIIRIFFTLKMLYIGCSKKGAISLLLCNWRRSAKLKSKNEIQDNLHFENTTYRVLHEKQYCCFFLKAYRISGKFYP